MNAIIQRGATQTIVISMLVLGMFVGFAPVAHAQYAGDGGCCDTGGYDYYDTSAYNTPSYDYYDTSAYNNTPSYDYYDTSAYNNTPGYYDTASYNPGYYDTSSSNPGYYDTATYNYGNTASPAYSYGTPSYSSGGYSTGGGYYVGRPSYNTPTYVDNTPIPTWPSNFGHVTATASAVGTPSHQTQTQNQQQQQSNSSYNSNPNTNTNVQNQAPINITNTNINNVPAPVYQAPVQQVVQYTLPYSMPTCTISISNSYYNSYSNQPVTLTWSSTNAFSASISPSVGTVNPSGSTTIYPTNGTTIYTMTVHGQGGSGTCQTQVVYQQQPPVTHTPPVAHAPYVSLSQIPYTGFDFGPMGNAIYWAGLLSFALAIAYLAIYYKGGLALATGTTGNRRRPVKYQHIVASNDEVVTAEPTAPVATTRQASFANLPTRGEHRNATADNMAIAQPATADEMPRIVITRA